MNERKEPPALGPPTAADVAADGATVAGGAAGSYANEAAYVAELPAFPCNDINLGTQTPPQCSTDNDKAPPATAGGSVSGPIS